MIRFSFFFFLLFKGILLFFFFWMGGSGNVSVSLSFYLFIFGCTGSSLLHELFSSCGKWGYSLVGVCGLLVVVISLVVEHRLQGVWACSGVAPQL